MMSEDRSLDISRILPIFIILGTLAAAVALGPVIFQWNVGVRELVTLILVMLVAILVLVPSDRVLKFGFLVWVATFGLGWRTIHVSGALNIHPSEALAWILFLAILMRSAIKRGPLDFSIPLPIWLLMPFVFLGILSGVYMVIAPFDQVLQEAKIFFVLIPSFYIVKWLVVTRADWERAILLSVIVAGYVSSLGLIDNFLPGLSAILAGKSSIETSVVTQEQGFTRVGFAFYGNFSAGFLIFTFFGMSIYHFMNSLRDNSSTRLLPGLLVLIELAGMYLSGYRGLWLAIGVCLLAYAYVQRRAWFLPVAMLAALPLLPSEFFNRLQSLVNPSFADSSQFNRIDRASFALNFIQHYPLTGVGFGGSGYVHADLIQIAGDLGIPALLVFLFLVLGTIVKTLRLTRQSGWFSEYAAALFATLCGLMVILSGEGLIVFIQLIVPVWFIFAMADKLNRLASEERAD